MSGDYNEAVVKRMPKTKKLSKKQKVDIAKRRVMKNATTKKSGKKNAMGNPVYSGRY